jgi:hypothetical protein
MALLEPSTTVILDMVPYEIQYIYIPLEKLESDTDYMIHAAFDGGYSVEIMQKRKAIETGEHLGQKSDFSLRFGNKLSQGMKLTDHKHLAKFQLTPNKRYKDDQDA